jgi:hypothetical protein
VTAQLREILTPIFKENFDLSVSYGCEILFLPLDSRLICKFNPNFGLESKFLLNPRPEFLPHNNSILMELRPENQFSICFNFCECEFV